MDSPEEFRRELLARATVRASADKNLGYAAFVELCGELLEEAEEFSDFTPCFFRHSKSGSRKLSVDGYAFDEADQSARMMVVDFSGVEFPGNLTGVEARKLFAELQAFVEESLAGTVAEMSEESSPEHGLARDLRARATETSRYRLYLASDRPLSTTIKDWPEGVIGGCPVEFHIWDLSRFHRAHLSRSGRDELVIDFSSLPLGGLPCLPASMSSGSYEGYLCVIPGAALADIYDKHGSRLLEGNVRAFLSTTGKVNKGIQQTLQREPDMFFAYNNGIAATASSVLISEAAHGQHIVSAADFQIVNGGQTTASMSYARRKGDLDLSDVLVQMKLSVVDDERAGTFIPLISRFSNSQNKVSDADFFANHEFHRRIEKISRRLRAPAKKGTQVESFWFYERARGQYAVELGRLSVGERKRFEIESPREQIITKTDLAKFENSWRQLPHEVSRGAQKNFIRFAEHITAEWERDPELFHDEYFRQLVVKALMFRTLERIVPKEDWYDGGYRANIVTFALAKLAHMVESRADASKFNFQKTWKAQEISTALAEQLRLIAKAAYGVIIRPEAGIQNVTEWCKKELAWQRMKSTNVSFIAEFEAELVAPEEAVSARRSAKSEAKIDAGLDALQEVIAFGADNWTKLRLHTVATKATTPSEDGLLRVASNPKWLPTDRQAKELMKLLLRLRSEGTWQ
ncbi:AIPR family protein [Variovorax sp. GB1P17]|uniref:AIPR family protein n=1 Tax=Variovorax sp. GB1P17 TaxID=3443740 RepID=UPI003F471AF0